MSKNMPIYRIRMIGKITNFMQGSFPFTYLSCPIFKGVAKQIFFENIVNKIISKISSWCSKLLSPGGRLTLIKNVLSSIPILALSIFDVPGVIFEKMNRAMANFLWHDSDNHHRRH